MNIKILNGGETEIRTQERVAPLPVFKTGAFNRSATRPAGAVARSPPLREKSTPLADPPGRPGPQSRRRALTRFPLFSRLGSFPNTLAGIPHSMGGISNRMKEVKRRRHRRKKLTKLEGKVKKATTSEKLVIAEKLRKMTPGCNDLIVRMGLEDRKR